MKMTRIDPRSASAEVTATRYRIEFLGQNEVDTWAVDEVDDLSQVQAWATADGRQYSLSVELPSTVNIGTVTLVRLNRVLGV